MFIQYATFFLSRSSIFVVQLCWIDKMSLISYCVCISLHWRLQLHSKIIILLFFSCLNVYLFRIIAQTMDIANISHLEKYYCSSAFVNSAKKVCKKKNGCSGSMTTISIYCVCLNLNWSVLSPLKMLWLEFYRESNVYNLTIFW